MNCQEALDLLYDIIDKEASEIDTQEVQRHLDHCEDCFKRFQLHGSLQALLSEKLKATTDITAIERLKGNVLAKLDAIDAQRDSTNTKKIPFKLPTVALAAAASLILLVGAAFFASSLYQHYTEYIPIERAHWVASDNIDSFKDNATTENVIAAVSRNFGLTMTPAHSGLTLVGAAPKEIKGMKVSQFVYSDGEHSVSVFIIPASKMTFSDDLMETQKEINGNSTYDHNCRGCRLVYTKNGGAIIVTASTDHHFELTEFNPISQVI